MLTIIFKLQRKTVSWKIGVTGAGATHDAERGRENEEGPYIFTHQRVVRSVVYAGKYKVATTPTADAGIIVSTYPSVNS